MPEVKAEEGLTYSAILINAHIVKSKNEARRLIDQGALKLDGNKISQDGPAQKGVLQAGKRHFIKIV